MKDAESWSNGHICISLLSFLLASSKKTNDVSFDENNDERS